MTEQLLAYLLDDLSSADRAAVDARLDSDPSWRQELERLRDCLAGCGDPADCGCPPTEVEELPPPCNLAERTCTLVESGEYSLRELACQPTGVCHRWRMADFTVAAGVLLALGAVMAPALLESREAARRTVCADNLRLLATHLVHYAENHGQQLPPIAPGQNAGMYSVALGDQSGISRAQLAELLTCPATQLAADIQRRRIQFRVPTHEELRAAQGPVLIALRQQMGGSYAYRFGFFDPRGRLHQNRFVGSSELPMLADAPQNASGGFCVTQHGPCGQNVLYQDQSVRFVSGCTGPGGDNLFLNLAGQHAAGLERDDFVLGRSEFEPLGTIFAVTDE